MEEKTLGVLGGVGPLATIYFADLVVKMTDAKTDQEHISMVILNHGAIPDRTDYILDHSKPNPLPVMIADAKKLQAAGCDYIVIPCNTAHYFYDEIQKNVDIPIINIIEETVKYAIKTVPGLKTLGVLATEGTIKSGSYERVADRYSIDCKFPDEEDKRSLMNIIYGEVKAGEKVDIFEFMRIIGDMKKKGCDAVILGCTEPSIIDKDFNLSKKDSKIIDSMEVLARRSIDLCGKKIKE